MADVESKDLKTEAEMNIEGDDRVYELGYLVVPTVKEEDLAAFYGNLKEVLSSLGASTISDDMPKAIPLAYQMEKVVLNVRSKFKNAYFGWTKFYLEPAKVSELKAKLELNPNILRFLVIKTVKENTISSKKFSRGEVYKGGKEFVAKREKEEGVVEVNKETIDQEIEAMVAA